MRQRWFALSTALLSLAALSGAGHAGVTTDRVTLTPQASPSCPSGKACLYSKSTDNRVYVVDANALELGSNVARGFRVSASCAGLSHQVRRAALLALALLAGCGRCCPVPPTPVDMATADAACVRCNAVINPCSNLGLVCNAMTACCEPIGDM